MARRKPPSRLITARSRPCGGGCSAVPAISANARSTNIAKIADFLRQGNDEAAAALLRMHILVIND